MTHRGAWLHFFLRTMSTEGLVDRKEVRGNIYSMGREIGGDVFSDRLVFVFLWPPRAKQQEVTWSDSKMEADGTTQPCTCLGQRTYSGFTCTPVGSCLQVTVLVCLAVDKDS